MSSASVVSVGPDTLMSLRMLVAVLLVSALGLPADALAQRIFLNGFEDACQLDTDGDRLTDCEEALRSTSPFDADSDGDGLSDGDEVLGSPGGLNLPAFGVNPRHKDLLIEMDWDEDSRNCFIHLHRPNAATIAEVKAFFAAAPVDNPDGISGINFIADFGQGPAPFTGGNLVDFANGVTGPVDTEFKAVKSANFEAQRAGYFRYQVHAHFWENNNTSSGYADIYGDNSVVTLNCSYKTTDYVRNTIIHELGHNLSLKHGGDTICNGLANYNSLMNYKYQLDGVDTDCDGFPNGPDSLGYSEGVRNLMTQGQLDEAQGLCALDHPLHKPIDWNSNGVIDNVPVSWSGPWTTSAACFGITVSADFDDYAALILDPLTPPGGGASTPPEVSGACASTPQP